MAEVWTMGEILVEIMRPRAGMPLNEPGEFLGPFPSGAPAIFIDTVARLGHSAGIIGAVAKDDFGRNALDRLRKDGVDTRHVEEIPGKATAVAFVTYFEDGSRRFIFHFDGTPAVMARFPQDAPPTGAKFFHVMGCSLMANADFRREIHKAVEHFHRLGARISFDPNIRAELLQGQRIEDLVEPVMRHCAVLMPGEAELRLLTGESEIQSALRKVFQRESLEIVVLKRGKKGASIHTRDGVVEAPVYPVEEVDATGAGDCFDAGFLAGLLENKPLADCGKIAAAAGALNAAALGPMEGVISADTVRRMIQEHP